MSHVAFRMMTESGVLRPGDREIRRGPGGVPLYATSQVSELLNYSLDVLFGPALKADQQKMPKVAGRPQAGTPSPSPRVSSRCSLKGMLMRLGLLDPPDDGQPPVTGLEGRIQRLESLLKAEQTLRHAQHDELLRLRIQVNRIDVLESDLAIERESGAQLVQWLQDAEQELADLRRTASPGSSRSVKP